jgi:hypothetical protein
MGSNEIRINDIGTVFYGTISDASGAVDISGATTKQIILLKPDGTSIQEDASFVTDGTDGQLSYTIQSGDLDVCGTWRIQWLIILSSGTWRSDQKTIKVYSNLV